MITATLTRRLRRTRTTIHRIHIRIRTITLIEN
jgi:hypothetical protein